MPTPYPTSPGRRPNDARGISLSGATGSAARAYDRALASSCAWRIDADSPLDAALQDAPRFVMAHALRAYQLICSRDPKSHRAARPIFDAALRCRADRYEAIHLAAIGAALEDDLVRMRTCLDELIDQRPHDLLALQVSQSIDYLLGDFLRMRARIDATLRCLPADLPGYGSALAMQAFALAENGEAAQAEAAAHAALEIDPLNARAHHAMAHVFEMNECFDQGIAWMNKHHDAWANGTTFLTHGWWHMALFHLAREDADGALSIYDRYVRGSRSSSLADLIDAASLLWRIALLGQDVGVRAQELADAWEPHIDDRICSFADLHAMLAFGLAGDGARAQRLEGVLLRSAARPTRHGLTTRDLGLPGVRALRAFMCGDTMRAIPLLASLLPLMHRIGGSHAQRDVLHLTLRAAIDGVRRPGHNSWRSAVVGRPIVGQPASASRPVPHRLVNHRPRPTPAHANVDSIAGKVRA
ncbi:MAG: tetratricopeptide repeat protein [Hydrogenophaga sp.]|nr:tetratricopeptide repeat protein [Hydrogenophaga sp.]